MAGPLPLLADAQFDAAGASSPFEREKPLTDNMTCCGDPLSALRNVP